MSTDTLSRNPLEEVPIELARAAAFFSDAHGRKPHIATLRRWAKSGCRGHKLEVIFIGNRLMTSREAVARFLAAINAGPAPAQLAIPTDAQKAGLELDRLMK